MCLFVFSKKFHHVGNETYVRYSIHNQFNVLYLRFDLLSAVFIRTDFRFSVWQTIKGKQYGLERRAASVKMTRATYGTVYLLTSETESQS